MRGLTAQVEAVLDRRLALDTQAPIAVALSGGGDSVALALMAHRWAAAHARPLLVLTVDHGLNPQSPAWTRACAALADRFGAQFQALTWTGPKPSQGLPAAARMARHGLLADAARAAGASVILMGHTADDLAESAIMRQTGSTTPDAREWSPAPVWPQGRGVFILRPLLEVGRSDLRAWLAAGGETWIEDPANADPRFARARARSSLGGSRVPCPPRQTAPQDLADLVAAVEDVAGLSLSRQALRDASADAAHAFVGMAALCAAGATRPPRSDRLARLVQVLRGKETGVATLAGARIEADAERVVWLREAGEMARGGLGQLMVDPGRPAIWDGRYEIHSELPLRIFPLAGHARHLNPAARAALARLPPRARGGLPAFEDQNGVSCPLLSLTPGVSITALALPRLRAACGVVSREPG